MSSEESIRPNLPPIHSESPSALDPTRQATFLAQLRQLLEAHQAAERSQADPPLAGFVRVICVLAGLGIGWGAARDLKGKDVWGVFLCVFIAIASVPDMLFYMMRRQRWARAMSVLDNEIETLSRQFSEEVEQSGGLSVLADRVELEALVNVLREQARGFSVSNQLPPK